jgi:hypothetical protein
VQAVEPLLRPEEAHSRVQALFHPLCVTRALNKTLSNMTVFKKKPGVII